MACLAGRLWRGCLVAIAVLFVFLVIAIFTYAAIREPEMRRILATFAVLSVVFLPLLVGLHEVGHVLGGWLAGFPFAFCVVGPLKFAQGQRKLRIRWIGIPQGFVGLAASLPTDDRDLRRRLVVMFAGGPAVSLLIAMIALAYHFGLGYHLREGGWLDQVVLIIGVWSLGIFVLTIVPRRVRGFLTDGAQLLLLLRGGPDAERHGATAALTGNSLRGTRPRDWPLSLLEAATSRPDGSAEDAAAAALAYHWALDRGDVDGAGAFLDRALAAQEQLPAVTRSALFLEAAYFTARHRGHAPTARAFLAQAKGSAFIEPYTRRRAEAAVLLAEGDREAARQRATEGLAAIECSPDAPGALVETDWLRDILALGAAEPHAGALARKEIAPPERP
jgi:hypothetical protein